MAAAPSPCPLPHMRGGRGMNVTKPLTYIPLSPTHVTNLCLQGLLPELSPLLPSAEPMGEGGRQAG
jgi:hypothetical protein